MLGEVVLGERLLELGNPQRRTGPAQGDRRRNRYRRRPSSTRLAAPAGSLSIASCASLRRLPSPLRHDGRRKLRGAHEPGHRWRLRSPSPERRRRGALAAGEFDLTPV